MDVMAYRSSGFFIHVYCMIFRSIIVAPFFYSYEESAGPCELCELMIIDTSAWFSESYRFRRLGGPAKS